VHAYQSYVWNRAVSERIRRFGANKVLIGDLALVASKEAKELLEQANNEEALETPALQAADDD